MYSGEALPGTSPFMQTLKNNKSFSVRSGNFTPGIAISSISAPKEKLEGNPARAPLKTSSYSEAFGSVGNLASTDNNHFGTLGNISPVGSHNKKTYSSKNESQNQSNAFSSLGNSPPKTSRKYSSSKFANKGFKK